VQELGGKVPVPDGVRIAATSEATPLQIRLFIRGPVRVGGRGRQPALFLPSARARTARPGRAPARCALTAPLPRRPSPSPPSFAQAELAVPGKASRPSPYAGRTFEAVVTVPDKYPHVPPTNVVFAANTLYHPSVKWAVAAGSDAAEVPGQVCHMLFTQKWVATMSIFSIGTLLLEHLKSPDLSSPVVPEIAMEVTERCDDFCKAAAAAAAKLPMWEAAAGGGGGGGGGAR